MQNNTEEFTEPPETFPEESEIVDSRDESQFPFDSTVRWVRSNGIEMPELYRAAMCLAVAMAMHSRLGEYSLLFLLDEFILKYIVKLAMYSYIPDLHFARLFDNILFRFRTQNGFGISYEIRDDNPPCFIFNLNDGMTLSLRDGCLRTITLNDEHAEIDRQVNEELYDSDGEARVKFDAGSAEVTFSGHLFEGHMRRPNPRVFDERDELNIMLQDPRNHGTYHNFKYVDGAFDSDEDVEQYYISPQFRLPEDMDQISNLMESVLYIALPARKEHAASAEPTDDLSRCPACGNPIGAGAAGDALCMSCWRARHRD
jgi:hypothetical protein